ncbi:MAG: serine hydrolase domain-containing protein [Planctomycetota bacterium]
MSLISVAAAAAEPSALPPPMAIELEAIRERFELPALAVARVGPDGIDAISTVGVRRLGDDPPVPATDEDLWHLGSCGKAMTATLIARLVEAGTLRFEQTLAESFPALADRMPGSIARITLQHLLTHRAGLPANFDLDRYASPADLKHPSHARAKVLRETLTVKLLDAPGESIVYSNWGYVLAGHVAESVTDQTFESLMHEHVFAPLEMTTAGFGGTGTLGQVDQPWPHEDDGRPFEHNGPDADNLPVMAPAGTMHMSLRDWAAFIAEHLQGRAGHSDFLTRATFERLHTPPDLNADPDAEDAFGWLAVRRAWAGDAPALTHAGDNTLNYALVWMAPAESFAILITTNRSDAHAACDAVAGVLIRDHIREDR